MAYFNKGIYLHEIAENKNSILEFDKAIQLAPAKSNYYQKRAESKKDINDYDGALADYEKAFNINKEYNFILYRASLFKSRKQYNNVIKECERYFSGVDSATGYAYRLRASAYTELKEYSKALQDYNRSLEIEPNSQIAVYQKAELYRRYFANTKEATFNYQKVIALDSLTNYSAFSHFYLGDSGRAVSVMNFVLENQDKDSINLLICFIEMAKLYSKMDDELKTLTYLKKGLGTAQKFKNLADIEEFQTKKSYIDLIKSYE